jgi:hypothetical protein
MCRNISGQMADGRGCRSIPEIKTDQVKVTRSLGRIARFHLPKGILACQQLGSTILRVGATRQSIKIYSILFYFIVSSIGCFHGRWFRTRDYCQCTQRNFGALSTPFVGAECSKNVFTTYI